MLRVSLLIQARERVTATFRRIRSAVRGMAREGERDVGRLGRAMGRLRSIGSHVGDGILPSLRRNLDRATALARRAGLSIARSLGRGLRNIALFGGTAALGGLGYLLYRLTAGTIQVASQMEQFQVILENTEGSARGARRAMAWVRNFAQTTPYEVADVMEAFVRLRAYGIDPTQGALRSLGNASSGMGKSIMDAVEMLADAQTGEFERLKEFGIRAQVTGNQVRFTYMRNNREMTRTTRKNAADIQRAITGIFDERFTGMMDRQSRTLAGLWSNIMDQIASFQMTIANAGFFDFVKGKVTQLLARINALASNGTLQRWAQQISQWLVRAGTAASDFFQNTDWAAVGRDVRDVAQAFWDLARAVAAVVGPVSRVAGVLSQLNQFTGVGQLQRLLSGQGVGVNVRVPVPTWLRRGPMQQPGRGPMPPSRGRLLVEQLSRRRAPAPARRPSAPAIRGQTSLIRHRTEVGGRLDIRVAASPGSSASVMQLSSANRNVPIAVTRGRAGTG